MLRWFDVGTNPFSLRIHPSRSRCEWVMLWGYSSREGMSCEGSRNYASLSLPIWPMKWRWPWTAVMWC